jgi:hypothetical protein
MSFHLLVAALKSTVSRLIERGIRLLDGVGHLYLHHHADVLALSGIKLSGTTEVGALGGEGHDRNQTNKSEKA